MTNPTPEKSQNEIADEWNRIAALRVKQIEEGKDLSFSHVLVPCILGLSSESDLTSVIDIGCGTGFLTKELARTAKQVTGVDVSGDSIAIARKLHSGPNIEFINSSIEDYASRLKEPCFTLAAANMALLTMKNLDLVLEGVSRILKPGGHFVFTVAHPCFWPLYWGYAFKTWFDYNKEILIESPFRISLESSTGLVTTHIHRPLEQYFGSLLKAQFIIDNISEPIPDKDIHAKYPKRWAFPRFLGMRCIRQ